MRIWWGSSDFQRIAKTMFWSAAGEIAGKGFFFLAMIILARLLGQSDWGQFGLVRTTVATFSTLGGIGLGLTANRFVAQYKDHDKGYSGEIVGTTYLLASLFGAIMAAILFGGASFVSVRFLGHPEMTSALRVAAVLVLLGSLNGAQIGILQGMEAYRLIAVCNAVQGCVALAGFAVGAYFLQLDGAILAFVIYTLVGVLVFGVAVHTELRVHQIRPVFWKLDKTGRIFWTFSIPVGLMGVAIAPFKWLVETWLGAEGGFTELGTFYAAMVLPTMLISLASTLHAPLVSAAARTAGGEGRVRLDYVSLYGTWYASIAIAAPLIAFPEAISLIFGEAYATSQFRSVCVLLLIYACLLAYYQGIMRLVVQRGSMWLTLWTNVVEGVTLIVAFRFFMQWGAVGLALAYLTSYVVRIAISLPVVSASRIASKRMLTDKYFVASVLVLSTISVAKIMSLR